MDTRPKTALVSIWCKIYTNNFSEEMVNRMATGQEIYHFLMKDSGNCFHDDGWKIPGDINLWYLGCNEKFGELRYNDKVLKWSYWEASFYNVELFITWCFIDGLLTKEQFKTLMGKIEEGKQFRDMYQIKDYLLSRQNKRPLAFQDSAALQEAS
jgi:hypothetical protein